MADEDVRVPAGWYPDPLGLPQLRWWDNHAWTEHISDARQPMVAQETVTTVAPTLAYADDEPDDGLLYRDRNLSDPFADPFAEIPADPFAEVTPVEAPTRREMRERERLELDDAGDRDGIDTPFGHAEPLLSLEAPARAAVQTAEPSPAARFAGTGLIDDAPTSLPYDLGTRFDDLLGEPADPRTAFSHLGDQADRFIPQPTREQQRARRYTGYADELPVSTGPIWVIALVPLMMLLVGLLFLLSGAAGLLSEVFLVLVIGVPYVLVVVLAMVDRTQLIRAGYEHTAHWAWALLTAPVYLIVRLAAVVRETGRGFGPLMTWGALSVFVAGAVIAVPGLLIALQPASFAAEMETSVLRDATLQGATLTVDCPDVPPLLIQQTVQCEATNDRGQVFSPTVSLQRANGWIDWIVVNWGINEMDGNTASN